MYAGEKRVLVVDDSPEIVDLVDEFLGELGYTCVVARTGGEALEEVRGGFKGVVVLDLELPDINGLDVFERLLQDCPSNPVIVFSAFASFEQVSEAIRLGAFDFIAKTDNPFDVLGDTVGRAWDSFVTGESEPVLVGRSIPGGVIGDSTPMLRVMNLVEQVVDTRVTVLLEGESGTGKEVIAGAIHKGSSRQTGPFVAINCAGIPATLLESELFGHERGAFTGATSRRAGKFEQANGGTVFLDEIGELDLTMQAKLLRVLQEREVVRIGGAERVKLDVRVLSATNRDLVKEVEEGRFRADLFYRLAVFRIRLPPLRERVEDLPALAENILSRFARSEGLSAAPVLTRPAFSLLQRYSFPGNVRELENILSHGAVVSRDGQIGIYDLPEVIRGQVDQEQAEDVRGSHRASYGGSVLGRLRFPEEVRPMEEIEVRYMREVLGVCDGNVSKAAKLMGLSRQTLYRKLPELKAIQSDDESRA